MNTLNPTHPRLLFTSEELDILRACARSGLRARALGRLEQFCRDCMTPGHPVYLDFRERQSELWTQRHGHFRVLPTLNALAAGYAFTQNTEFGDFARDALFTIIEHGLADVKASAWGQPYEGWRHGPGHDKGKFAQSVAFVYDMCFDRLSGEQRQRVARYAIECIELAAQWSRFDIDQIANNRGIRGLLVKPWLTLALEGDADLGEEPQKVYDSAAYQIDVHLFHAFDAGGAPYEGPGYAGTISDIALISEALRRRGGPNLLMNNRFERFPEYLLYELVPGGGSVNNLNDADHPCGSVMGSLHLLGTDRGRLLPWLVHQLDLHPDRTPLWLDPQSADADSIPGAQLLDLLLWWDESAPPRTPEDLGYPRSHWFPTRGVASLRTGWAPGTWLASHFCGRQERRCHRQGDYNHVTFYALGETFLADAGYGASSGRRDMTKAIDRWYMDTRAHNCVLIDDESFRDVFNTTGWGEGELLDFQHTEALDTSLGDASSCVGPDHRVRQALRRVVLVRGGPAQYLAVIDVNEKDGEPFCARAQWQTLPGNRIEPTAGGFLIHGRSSHCVGRVLYPGDAKLEPGAHRGLPHMRVSARGPVVETVTVFCPLGPGEQAPDFRCERTGPGSFTITCARDGSRSTLQASAATRGPLRQPHAVQFNTA